MWVVRENPEGGWRLVIRYSNNSRHVRMDEQHDAEGNEPQRATENVTLAWCDFSADGVIVENESFGFRMTPATLFPRLPRNAEEAANGWSSTSARMDETFHYRMAADSGAGQCAFEATRESSMKVIYGLEYKDLITFDLERGLPEVVSSETRQNLGGGKGSGSGTTKRVGIETHTPDWCRAYADEAQRFFAAR